MGLPGIQKHEISIVAEETPVHFGHISPDGGTVFVQIPGRGGS
jgi:hypothetical protein